MVAVKRVLDANVALRVKSDGTGADLTGAKMSMNPFDEIAVEEAVRLKEAGTANEVVVVSIGPAQAVDTLRTAQAMGADRAILVKAEGRIEPLAVAKLLQALARREGADLVLLGRQAIDDDSNQTGQMLAALLGWPQATFASALAIEGRTATVTREVDSGRETLQLTLPAIVTTDLRLNEPRYVTLPGVMKARQKPLEQLDAAVLNVGVAPRQRVVRVEAPPPRKAGIIVSSVDELVSKLKSEARVI
jgi:electron transfer flavoprotein beta subunit